MPCHPNCDSCSGPSIGECFKCKSGYPSWEGYCYENCGQIGLPQNLTYIYNKENNTCIPCYDFYYTTNWIECKAQPFPVNLTVYNNQYMILSFSSPVCYSQKSIKEIFSLSISGGDSDINLSWDTPYWEQNSYSKDVFIEIKINNILSGDESIYVYMDNIYITDSRGYNLLARNSTSKSEFLPLSAKLVKQDYISSSDRAIISGAGNGVIISMLIALGFNVIIAFLSSGSMELMWQFLNIVQILNYIPNLNLRFPSTLILMFSYLGIANSDIPVLANFFEYVFNLNDNTFPNDSYIHENFNNNGYSSMKILMNLQSQLAIIVLFVLVYALILILKTFSKRCLKRGKIFDKLEQGILWNVFIRFYLESFLEINTSAYINVVDLDFSDGINIFCSTISLLMLCLSILFPVMSCFYLFQYKSKLHNEDVLTQYGALYEEYNHKRWFQYMHATFFMGRRILFITILVFLSDFPLLQMILVFIMMKPYKQRIVNTFSIINETFLFVVGCYLFIFADDSQRTTSLRFYAWIVIGIVILMVVLNLLFIFPYKIYETYLKFQDRRRINRLKEISKVEQKYLLFDYKKFFQSTLKLQLSKEPRIASPKPPKEVKPTQIYYPTDESSEESEDEIPERQSLDQIPPEAYSNNQPLILKQESEEGGPADSQIDMLPAYLPSQDSQNLERDQIDPRAISLDKTSQINPIDTQQPGFQWLNQIKPDAIYNTYDGLDDGPQYYEQPYINNMNDYPDNLTEPNRYDSSARKKRVSFSGLDNHLSNTDGFKQVKKTPNTFFDNALGRSQKSNDIFKSDSEDDNNNQAWQRQNL